MKIFKNQTTSEVHVKKFKSQEVFVKREYEFPCANGTSRLPYRPRLSFTAQGNLEKEDDVEIEEGDKKREAKQKMRGLEWRIHLST